MAQDQAVFEILPTLVSKGIFQESISAVDVFDLDYFESRIADLKLAFPEDFCHHALALKANPIRGVVQFAINKGLGAEAASICETLHALSLGLEPAKVIYDSPCKTKADLAQAMHHGVQINLDNEHELEMVSQLLASSDSKSTFGLRLNPVVGAGALPFTSTATRESKFGLPITTKEAKEAIIGFFQKYPWLTGIHFHIGSQGIPLSLFGQGAKVCMDFVVELEALGIKIKTVNIGGGLPSSYIHPEEPLECSFQKYRELLENLVPQLFSGKYQVVTEFGRSLLLKAGTTLSKVEYVKRWIVENTPILLTHVGANQFYTEVYLPDKRRHRFDLADCDGKGKDEEKILFDIAGPLCFQGDYLAKQVKLAHSAKSGDILIMHETGAYTMSMYSKFNSNIPSPVYGFSLKSNRIWCFKERETLQDCLSFFGSKQPMFV